MPRQPDVRTSLAVTLLEHLEVELPWPWTVYAPDMSCLLLAGEQRISHGQWLTAIALLSSDMMQADDADITSIRKLLECGQHVGIELGAVIS
jgi:hypothetical protein